MVYSLGGGIDSVKLIYGYRLSFEVMVQCGFSRKNNYVWFRVISWKNSFRR